MVTNAECQVIIFVCGKLGLTILFHGQERNLATQPSLWPAHSYGTVYQQQFVKLTACIHSSANSNLICLLYVLMPVIGFYKLS